MHSSQIPKPPGALETLLLYRGPTGLYALPPRDGFRSQARRGPLRQVKWHTRGQAFVSDRLIFQEPFPSDPTSPTCAVDYGSPTPFVHSHHLSPVERPAPAPGGPRREIRRRVVYAKYIRFRLTADWSVCKMHTSIRNQSRKKQLPLSAYGCQTIWCSR